MISYSLTAAEALIAGCSRKSIFRSGEWFSQALKSVGRDSRAILGASDAPYDANYLFERRLRPLLKSLSLCFLIKM